MATTASWIHQTPDVCGGDACIRDTRHTIWGLVELKRLGLTDHRVLDHHPDLTAADLETAWEYYGHHQDEIDLAIRENTRA